MVETVLIAQKSDGKSQNSPWYIIVEIVTFIVC